MLSNPTSQKVLIMFIQTVLAAIEGGFIQHFYIRIQSTFLFEQPWQIISGGLAPKNYDVFDPAMT